MYDILNCCALGFQSLWRSSRVLIILTFAIVREKISITVRSVASNMPFIDMYLWEPVGALISTVLSQMILGSRVYAVCCLDCLAFSILSTLFVSLGILTKQGCRVRPWIYFDCWSGYWWHSYQYYIGSSSICGASWHRTPLRGSNGAIWLASCLLGEENLKDYPYVFFSCFYCSQSRFFMTQTHSCRSPRLFSFHGNLHIDFFQINSMESLRILESGSRYTLVQHYLAGWTSLFLCHFFHERRQCHNLLDCTTVSESSEFNVKNDSILLKLLLFDVPLSFFLLGPLSYWKLFSPVVWFLISVPPLTKLQPLSLSLVSFHGPITQKPERTITLPVVL